MLGEPCLAILERCAEPLLAAFDVLLPIREGPLVAGDVLVEGGALVAVKDPSEPSTLFPYPFEPLLRLLEVVGGALQLVRGTMLVGQQHLESRERLLGGIGLFDYDVIERERLCVTVAQHLDEAVGQWVVGLEVGKIALDRGRRDEIEAGFVAVA